MALTSSDMAPETSESLATPSQVAEFLQVSELTVKTWRYTDTGPAFLRVGRHVRYRWDDVLSWLAERKSGER